MTTHCHTKNNKSVCFKARVATDPTKYIFNQSHADQVLIKLLDYLKQTICKTSSIENSCLRGESYMCKLLSDLKLVDESHRSYCKVRSLVLACIALDSYKKYLQGHEEEQVLDVTDLEELVLDVMESDQANHLSHFLARSLLLMILLQKKKLKDLTTSNQSDELRDPTTSAISHESKQLNNPQSSSGIPAHNSQYRDACSRIRQKIVVLWERLRQINFGNRVEEELAVKKRLWQSEQINELLVYQYHSVITEYAKHDGFKARKLFRRGVQICQRYLGPTHRLSRTLKNIQSIQTSTSNILKFSSPSPKNYSSIRRIVYPAVNQNHSVRFYHSALDRRKKQQISGSNREHRPGKVQDINLLDRVQVRACNLPRKHNKPNKSQRSNKTKLYEDSKCSVTPTVKNIVQLLPISMKKVESSPPDNQGDNEVDNTRSIQGRQTLTHQFEKQRVLQADVPQMLEIKISQGKSNYPEGEVAASGAVNSPPQGSPSLLKGSQQLPQLREAVPRSMESVPQPVPRSMESVCKEEDDPFCKII